jgi:hypothetical protein
MDQAVQEIEEDVAQVGKSEKENRNGMDLLRFLFIYALGKDSMNRGTHASRDSYLTTISIQVTGEGDGGEEEAPDDAGAGDDAGDAGGDAVEEAGGDAGETVPNP